MSQPPAAPEPAAAAPMVLVVEDEEMVGEVVRAMLRMGGIESILVRSPVEALKLLEDRQRTFDLLLTDFRMPQMTGIELIQLCKPMRPSLKTVLYSGNMDERETAGYPIQPDQFLRKPFTPKTLNELVRSVLGS